MAEALEDVGEDGDHPDQQDRRDEDRRRHDARRVDHRAFDLALQLGGLLEVVGEAHEDRVEDAADLSRLDEARVQVAEDLPVPADRIRERRAGIDVVLDLSEDLPERLRVGLRREDVQALHDRQTRVDHRGELPREDDDVARLYLRADRGHLDLEVETLALFLDARGLRLNALRAETDDDGLAARRLHLALQRLPLGRDALPFVDGHRASSACGPSEPRLAEHRPDLLDLRGVADRLLRGDEGLLDEGDQGLAHRLHAELRLTDLHLGVDLVHLLLADEVADRGVRDHHLGGEHAPAPVAPRDELLRDHRLEHERELRAYLRLLVRREDVDDAVDRLHGAVGMERREGEVARLRDDEGCFDGLEVAHFTDQHDIGILPQHVLEGLREAVRVREDLALVHEAALVHVHELDRILDRDDVLVSFAVDLVDHGGERRALPAARPPGHQHEPARQLGEARHGGREPELLELRRLVRDHAEGAADRALLQVEVATEAAHPFHPEREVELAFLFELLLLCLGEEAVTELFRVVAAERRMREGDELTVESDDRWAVGGEVQVRRLALDHLAQERIHRRHCAAESRRRATGARRARWPGRASQRQLCVTSRPAGNGLEQNCPGARAVLARLCRAPLLRCPRTPAAGLTALAVRLRRASRGLAAVPCSPPPRFARLGGGPLLASAALRAAWP